MAGTKHHKLDLLLDFFGNTTLEAGKIVAGIQQITHLKKSYSAWQRPCMTTKVTKKQGTRQCSGHSGHLHTEAVGLAKIECNVMEGTQTFQSVLTPDQLMWVHYALHSHWPLALQQKTPLPA